MAKKIIKDNRGQWAHPGKITKIASNKITMKGVNYPVLGVSDKGDKKLMLPNKDYTFKGTSVTEYPIMSDGGQLKKLDQLTNFTDMNKSTGKGKKAQKGAIVDKMINSSDSVSNLRTYTRPQYLEAKEAYISGKKPKNNPFYDNWDIEQYAVSRFEKEPYQSLTLGTTKSLDGNEWPDMIIEGIKAKNANTVNKSLGLNPIATKALYDKQGQLPVKQKHGGKIKKAQYGLEALQTDLNPYLSEIQKKAPGAMSSALAGIDTGESSSALDKVGGLGGALQTGTDLLKGFQVIKQEKQQRNQAKQFLALSKLTEEAASGPVDKPKRKYVRPEDQILDPNSVASSYGTGSNFLAKNGGKAQFGAQAGQLGNMLGSWIGGGKGVQTGAGMVGGTIGSTVGKLIPIPGASAILGGIGGLVGGLIGGDKAKQTAEDQEAALLNTKGAAFKNTIQNQYSGFMRHGGHLRENQMAMGGNLKVYKGEAEPISINPYLPEGGQTVMFKGPSHEDGGMPVKYGKSKVEVEGGEPAVQLKDGGKSSNLTIFGDMKIPSYGVSEIGDEKAKGKKFKSYISDLSKLETKQNKTIIKGGLHAGEAEDDSPFDQLKISTGKAMITGADMKLKEIAQKKQTASAVQNAILETADEFGLKSDELAKGNIKKAKNGAKIAQWGTNQEGYRKEDPTPGEIATQEVNPYMYNDFGFGQYHLPRTGKTDALSPKQIAQKVGGRKAPQMKMTFPNAPTEFPTLQEIGPGNPVQLEQFTPKLTNMGEPTPTYGGDSPAPYRPQTASVGRERNGLGEGMASVINAALPYLRPSNRTNLDPNQLSGEMYALSSNQLDPVQAQLYTPLLEQATDISLQDQMNANQADFNALQRSNVNNPAAQAALAAQKYAANSGVLGQQFRINQENKLGTYNRNRGVLNDATLKNLQILDQQYVRQATAKSNTKAVAQQALNSIADKIAKNKLENRTLGVYENLYNYRFGQNGYAWNLNPLAQFNTEGVNLRSVDATGKEITQENTEYRDKFNILKGSRNQTKVKTKTKNGGIVKSYKSF
jgi:hypothetical protein